MSQARPRNFAKVERPKRRVRQEQSTFESLGRHDPRNVQEEEHPSRVLEKEQSISDICYGYDKSLVGIKARLVFNLRGRHDGLQVAKQERLKSRVRGRSDPKADQGRGDQLSGYVAGTTDFALTRKSD